MRFAMHCSARRGLGDIGRHFSDQDPVFKNIDSRVLLRSVREKVTAAGYEVVNIDATVIAQAPRMAPHIPMMNALIAGDLNVAPGTVNVKATTTEKLGFTGRGEGIAAQAICLIEKSSL